MMRGAVQREPTRSQAVLAIILYKSVIMFRLGLVNSVWIHRKEIVERA